MNDDTASSRADRTDTNQSDEDDQVDPSPPDDDLVRVLRTIIADLMPGSGAALHGVNVVLGDVVGRDKFATATPAAARPNDLGQIPEVVLRKVRDVFVPSATYERARDVLAENAVVVLAGAAHTGKWTAAVRLLLDSGHDSAVELRRPETTDRLLQHAFARNTGYVLRWTRGEGPGLTSADLSLLRGTLAERGSRLVVVTTDTPDLGGNVVTWHAPADAALVLERHVRFYLAAAPASGDATIDPDELLHHPEVVALRDGHDTPRGIDGLARSLAQVALGNLSLEQAVEQDDERARAAVETWFGEHRDQQRRCVLRIAASVLRGSRYQAIVEAADRLAELSGTPEEPSAGPFGTTRDEELKDIGAYVHTRRRDTHYGPDTAEVVDMINTVQAVAVLDHAWTAYPRLRGPLTDWLDELAETGDQDLGACAATAAGMLARHDFGQIQQNLIRRWAQSRDPRVRLLAAGALGVLAWFPDRVDQALGLVHHWVTQRGNRRLAWTAVAAYATELGLIAVDTALRDLVGLATRATPAERTMLSWGIGAVFDTGAVIPENYGKTLAALRDAVPARIPRQQAEVSAPPLHVFLSLTRHRRPGRTGDPVLFEQYSTDAPFAADIVTLWRHALDCRPTRSTALDCLRDWVEIVDRAPERIGAVTKFLGALCAGDYPDDTRPKVRIEHALRTWGRAKNTSSPAARRLWYELFQ